MKGKFKKILAGLTLGIVGAATLSGCSLNSSFDNVELDGILNKVDAYVETQTTQEYVKNRLIDLIMQAKLNNTKTNDYTIVTTETLTNELGMAETNIINEKCYFDEETNIYKLYREESYYYKDDISRVYTKIDISEETNEFDVYSYDLENDTCIKTTYESEYDIHFASIPGGSSSAIIRTNIDDLLNSAYDLFYDENSGSTNIIMDKIADNEYKFRIMKVYNPTEEEDPDMHGLFATTCYSLVFKDGKLSVFEYIRTDNRDSGDNVSSLHSKIEIEYNTEDFVVDTSNCILVPNPYN